MRRISLILLILTGMMAQATLAAVPDKNHNIRNNPPSLKKNQIHLYLDLTQNAQ